MTYKRNLIAASIALAIVNPTAYAQDQEAVESAPMEEVEVTGIRSSLLNAMEMKRSNVGTMEAISAEDFGKFPDGNLAESLARVPGIAIDRSNVEGQKIAVRGFGPEFNLVTLNGRQMPTAPGVYEGGRSYNFGDIASPGVSAVEVFKSANSALPSGGIGATVNMVTTKPLKIEGTKKSLSFNFLEDTTSEAGDTPIEAAVLYSTNQDRWGFSLSGSYQERQNREEGTRESNWITVSEQPGRVDPLNPAYTNNNARADGETFYQEPTAYLIKDNDRVRTNAQATFQFAFTEDILTTIDYTYSNVDFQSEGLLFGSWLGGWDTIDATINENGAFTDVVVGNRSYDHEVTWQNVVNTNKSVGFNTEWHINDAWSLSFDAHHSTAAVDGGELDNTLGVSTDIKGIVTHTNGGKSGINTFAYDTDFAPENYLITSATIRDGFKENEIDQFQVTGTWTNVDGGFVTSVDFGVSHLDNSFRKITRVGGFGAQGATPDDYDDSLFRRTRLGDFMNSFDPDVGTDYYYQIDPTAAFAAFVANNGGVVDNSDGTVCCTAGGIDSNERVNETLDSAFFQVNMETEIRGMPLNIVAGLRYESADTESISLSATPSGLRWDMIDGIGTVNDGVIVDSPRYGSNSIVLPSIAMSLGLDEQQVVRLSLSKTMGRAGLQDLSSQLNFGNRDYYQATIEGGNPDLAPLESNNFDVSYENYYAEGSYFAINYFRKEIKNFVGSRTETGNFRGYTDPTLSALALAARECVQEWVDAGRPDPGFPGEPGATGHCVSQQALWAQPWMNDNQHAGWVALGMQAGVDVSAGYPWSDGGADDAVCASDGWWRCEPGFINGTAGDPLATFEITSKYNMNSGTVSGFEFSLQHLFADTPFGMQFNATLISGGDVEVDKDIIGEQFLLPGLGDSGNLSFFYEDEKHTLRIAYNYRGETVAGFANYNQPLFVAERSQIDASYSYNYNDNVTLFVDAANINDEETRLFVRNEEMLFLSQDHGPVVRFGLRANF
ncbi:MAG: TonB-dependent receptor [Gammaproteobacteria bacterium]|nr:TonB-dependent receptor [Gammaproteobacteria bacterium]